MNIRNIMQNVSGGSFVGLDTTTTPVLLGGKSNAMKGRVRKHVKCSNVMVFTNQKSNAYDNMVKRRLEQEGKDPESFNLSPRVWGERIPNTCFVQHKGSLYLEVIFLRAGEVSYTLDGESIAKDAIQGLKASPEGKQGGLSDDNKVVIRTFKVASLDAIHIDKKVFEDIEE